MFGLHPAEGTVFSFEVRLVQESSWIDHAVSALANALRAIIDERGHATFGISGGTSPMPVFERLAGEPLEWERVTFVQVDERCVPKGDPDRNLTGQRAALGRTPAAWLELPVGPDGEIPDGAALARYEAEFTALTGGRGLDLVQLGLGADGHTASLIPGDAVLDERERIAAVSGPYQGHRRVTLTIPALEACPHVVWLVPDIGGEKADAYEKLRAGDPSIPAGRLEVFESLVIASR